MLKILAFVFAFAQAAGSGTSFPATDVTNNDIHTTLKQAIASKTTDTPIRTVDAGGHHVGIGIVHRARSSGPNMLGSASHDSVTEVYQVLEGSGTLVTGGTPKSDMVIIPAGTPHWFSEIQQDIVYTVVRVDPARVVTLK